MLISMLIIPALILFTILFLPFFGMIPYLDGNTEFLVAANFHEGNYFTNWIPYHAPLKPIVSSLFFALFGYSSYTFLGYIFGILGILTIYQIAKTLFDKHVAIISSILLACSGLYVSTGVFSLNDFLETIFILIAFLCYIKKRLIFYAVAITCAVLLKETAILFPVSIIIVEAYKKKFHMVNIIPFIGLILWVVYVHAIGHDLWNSWNFSDTPEAGSAHTIINNIFTGKIFNKYAYQNWLHLFLFNFNWFFWLLAALAIIRKKTKITSPIAILAIFTALYTLTILSFQTYTIVRYTLPIIPFVYLLASVFLIHTRVSYLFVSITLMVMLLSLFTSSDPLSDMIWHKRTVLHQSFYSHKLDGKDGITYNLQFLMATKERDTLIRSRKCKEYVNNLDITPKTLKLLNLPSCI